MRQAVLPGFLACILAAAAPASTDTPAPPPTLPPIWDQDPRAATLALIEAGRTDHNRQNARVLLEEQGAPPERITIVLTQDLTGCFRSGEGAYVLIADPAGSTFMHAQTSAMGGTASPFYLPSAEIRWAEVPYADAHKIAAMVWWLARVRTEWLPVDTGGGGGTWSTADIRCRLHLRAPGVDPIQREGRLWPRPAESGIIPTDLLNWDFDEDVFINFAGRLITAVLPARLGAAWAQQATEWKTDSALFPMMVPTCGEADHARLRSTSARILESALADDTKLSAAAAAIAARTAGTMGFADLRPLLDRLAERPRPLDLDRALTTARRQLEARDDAEALLEWATSGADGAPWARHRLAAIDRPRFVDMLEAGFAAASDAYARSQFLQVLRRAAPERAVAVAASVPAGKWPTLDPLVVEILAPTASPDSLAPRLRVLVPLLAAERDITAGRAALDALVPREDPLRYADPAIDAALVQVASGKDDSLAPEALSALARRGHPETFTLAERLLQAGKGGGSIDSALASAALAGQAAPGTYDARLTALLDPALDARNPHLEDALWAAWAAEQRPFKDRVERIAATPASATDIPGTGPLPTASATRLARDIVTIWSAPDAAAHARALVTLRVHHAGEFEPDWCPERSARLAADLAQCLAALSPAERGAFREFLREIEATLPPDPAAHADPRSFLARTRAAL